MAEDGGMNFETAIDRFIADMRVQGRLTSPLSERGYRSTLLAHAEDVQNRNPLTSAARTSSAPSNAGHIRTRKAPIARSS
jgi:hypothetical protein